MTWKTKIVLVYLIFTFAYVGLSQMVYTNVPFDTPAYYNSYSGNTTIGNYTMDLNPMAGRTPPSCGDLSNILNWFSCIWNNIYFLFTSAFSFSAGIFTIFAWFWIPLTIVFTYILITDAIIPALDLIPFT